MIMGETRHGFGERRNYTATAVSQGALGPRDNGDCFAIQACDSGKKLNTVVLDLEGHGLRGGPYHELVQQVVTSSNEMTPSEILAKIEKYWPKAVWRTATAIAVQVDTRTDTIRIARAGCPLPIYKPAGGKARVIDEGPNHGIIGAGVFDFTSDERLVLPLHEGDQLVIVTDGITDCGATDGKVLGVEGVLDLIDNADDQIAAKILAATEHSHDDRTVVSVAIHPIPARRRPNPTVSTVKTYSMNIQAVAHEG